MGWQDAPARTVALGWHGRLNRARIEAVNGLAVLLWLAGIARLLAPAGATALQTAVLPLLAGVVALLVLPDLSRSLRAPLTLTIALLAVLMLHTSQTQAARAALAFAGPFGAFLVSIAALRGALLSPARLAAARLRLAAQDSGARRSVLLLLSCLLGGVFSVGGLPLLAPLLADCPPHETDRLASAVLCGNALALLWSPFTVGLGFAAAAVGVAGGFAFLPAMLAAGLAGLLVALAVHGWPRPAALRRAAATALPLVPPFAAAVAATLALAALFRLQVTDAVVLLAPGAMTLAAALRLLRAPPPGHAVPASAAAGDFVRRAGEAVRDLPMYMAGFALARALGDSGLFGALTQAVAHSGVGAGFVLPGLSVLMALAGLPALVSGGVVAAAAAALMPGPQPGARLVVTLFAWVATAMLSFTGMGVLATSGAFGTTVRRLVFGRNLAVVIGLGVAIALMFG